MTERYALDKLLTVAEAADLLGIKERRMQSLVIELGLGRPFGKTHILTPADIDKARNRRGPGNPQRTTK